MAQNTASHDINRHKRGGLYFEGFNAGEVFEHRYTRTVTQMDNMLFSNMTLNPQPLHIDRQYCEEETEWGQPLMNSFFTLGLMVGISVSDISVGTTVANLGMTETKFPHPVFDDGADLEILVIEPPARVAFDRLRVHGGAPFGLGALTPRLP